MIRQGSHGRWERVAVSSCRPPYPFSAFRVLRTFCLRGLPPGVPVFYFSLRVEVCFKGAHEQSRTRALRGGRRRRHWHSKSPNTPLHTPCSPGPRIVRLVATPAILSLLDIKVRTCCTLLGYPSLPAPAHPPTLPPTHPRTHPPPYPTPPTYPLTPSL